MLHLKFFSTQIVFSATFHDPDLSVALTRSTVTLHSPDLLCIIRGNGHFSQAVGDTSFPLWLCGWSRKNTHISRISNYVTHLQSYTNNNIAGNSTGHLYSMSSSDIAVPSAGVASLITDVRKENWNQVHPEKNSNFYDYMQKVMAAGV